MKQSLLNVETLLQITRELRYVVTSRTQISFQDSNVMYQVMLEEINELGMVLNLTKNTIDDIMMGSSMHHYVTRLINRLEENHNLLAKAMEDKGKYHHVVEYVLELYADAQTVLDIANMVEQSKNKERELKEQQKTLEVEFIVDDNMAREDDSMPMIKRPVRKG